MAVITITKENFAQEVLQSEKPVINGCGYITGGA